jgi:hypothetical protein
MLAPPPELSCMFLPVTPLELVRQPLERFDAGAGPRDSLATDLIVAGMRARVY